jgi:polyhydroxyalkanoate synthase
LNPEAQARLQKLRARLSEANPAAFETALAKESVARARQFIAGVKLYQNHPVHRNMPEAPVVSQEGTTRLRDYNPRALDAPVVLVIPSLINRFDILDLDKNHSFLRALVEQGFHPLVVDWDEPGPEEENFSLTDYIMRRLVPALEIAFAQTQRRVHVLGYCMGGLLALALAVLRPERVRTLMLLATPWDFSSQAAQYPLLAEQAEPQLQAFGHLPIDYIQSVFALFQPMQVFTKFVGFAALDSAGEEARNFVLLEDWLNDGVPLTANVARECLLGWYGENLPGQMKWSVADRIIDPRTLNIPAYVLAPGKDRIVPPESALPLGKLLPRATLHQPMTGHIGLIASRTAPQQVWNGLFKWLTGHK